MRRSKRSSNLTNRFNDCDWIIRRFSTSQYLVDESSTVGGQVDQGPLLDLKGCLEDLLDTIVDAPDRLDGPVPDHDLVDHVIVPKAAGSQVIDQVSVHDDKFARRDTSGVHVERERLKGLVAAQNLRGRRGRHGCDQERVCDSSVVHDLVPKQVPVPETGKMIRSRVGPKIELKQSLGQRRSSKRAVPKTRKSFTSACRYLKLVRVLHPRVGT